jgi:hypothetical protein
MRKTPAGLFVVLLACTGAQQTPTSVSEPPSTTTVVTESPTTSTAPVASTTTTAPVVETWREPLQITLPTLSDGRPATFLAVNDDYAAVEVDTMTGDVIRAIAQIATAEDVENAECSACVNAVDAIWRLADGTSYLMSECCEPAAGAMYWMRPDEIITPDVHEHDRGGVTAWAANPSPASRVMASASYGVSIDSPEDGQVWRWLSQHEFYASTPPSWSLDLSTLWVVGGDGDVDLLWTIEPATSAVSSTAIPWLGTDEYLSGLGTQVSGRLVTFRLTPDGDDDFENDLARAIVFEPTGELVAEFDVEPGSRMGGYDPSGRFLIYVDGEGTVRWQGVGQAGSLGEGYLFASW